MAERYDGIEVALDAKADLGEGAWWDAATQTLLWLDLFQGRIHSFHPVIGNDTSIALRQPIGSFVLRADGGILAAVRDGVGFAHRRVDGLELVVPVEADDPRMRANDGACDALGRFWYGTMAYDESPRAGTVYRVDPDLTVTPMLRGTTTSNGIDWSPDHKRMYHADTGTGTITAFAFDLARGTLADPTVIFAAPAGAGSPDGLCVDSSGDIWVAMWDGYSVLRLAPDGTVKQVIALPVARVTSVAFGGPDLDDLYVTTARRGLSPEQLSAEPHAGSIFRLHAEAIGLLPNVFSG